MTRSYSVGLEELVASGYRRKLRSAGTGARLTTTGRVPSALRDCALTWMAGRPAALLIPGRLVSVSCPWIPPTFDLSEVGGIQGQLTLTNLPGINSAAGLPAIQVSAQSLSADGTRPVVVSRAPVPADRSFLLYPLAT